MNYGLKKLLFKMAFFSIVFCCIAAYEFLVTDDPDTYGNLVYFNKDVKNGDIILRNSLDTNDVNVGIIEMGMFGKVYVWDNQNTVKHTLYDWAKKSKNSYVTVYRNLIDIKPHEMNQHEIDSLVHWHKLEFITAN